MKYKVIERELQGYLEVAVENHLDEGWQLQGGVTTTYHGTTCYYVQAMVKSDEVTINAQESMTPAVIDLSEFLHSKLA